MTSSLQNNWMVDRVFLEHLDSLDCVLEEQLLQPGQLGDRYKYNFMLTMFPLRYVYI